MAYVHRVTDDDDPAAATELSIGALSVATGVPVDTLRTWERRYAFPRPLARKGGSHRRYSSETVAAVQLVVRALQLGHRASAVVGRNSQELRRLIEVSAGVPAPELAAEPDAETVRHWISLTMDLDADQLVHEFQRRLAERPAVDFLETCLGPYLDELGRRWSDGSLRISHEHFATECVMEFLRQRWRPLSEARSGPGSASIVMATPPGERHSLGLHMAAWVVALSESRVVFLGPDVPMREVAFAVRHHAARGVALSISAAYRGDITRELRDLRAELPDRVAVALGGRGAPAHHRAALVVNSFAELSRWSKYQSLDNG